MFVFLLLIFDYNRIAGYLSGENRKSFSVCQGVRGRYRIRIFRPDARVSKQKANKLNRKVIEVKWLMFKESLSFTLSGLRYETMLDN
jgi:hypothetical protein